MNIAGVTSLEGFICPACLVDFPSAAKLQDHWMKFHSPKPSTVRGSNTSNDYEEIPDDTPSSYSSQVCDFWCFQMSGNFSVWDKFVYAVSTLLFVAASQRVLVIFLACQTHSKYWQSDGGISLAQSAESLIVL